MSRLVGQYLCCTDIVDPQFTLGWWLDHPARCLVGIPLLHVGGQLEAVFFEPSLYYFLSASSGVFLDSAEIVSAILPAHSAADQGADIL